MFGTGAKPRSKSLGINKPRVQKSLRESTKGSLIPWKETIILIAIWPSIS